MAAPNLSLLAHRRFGPLFGVQFLGAFNDNLLKFALLFLANFSLYKGQPGKAEMLATIATGLFILPYFLFSSIAGQLADGFDKAKLARSVKLAEVAIMTLAITGFWFQSVPLLLTCLFGMGVHSTVFGPIKYSMLPQHLGGHEIIGGTGLIEAGTFVAILGGQLLGGVIAPWQAGLVATAIAVAGLIASLFIPPAPPVASGAARLRIDWNIARGTWRTLQATHGGRTVWLAIVGISWFFSAGAVLLSELAPLVSNTLGAGPDVVTLFLLVFSTGVALGSLLVNHLLSGEISARFAPVAALAMAGFLIDLWIACRIFTPVPPGTDWRSFITQAQSLHVILALAGIAVAGGIFIVPLYAILQTHSDPANRSQVIAANNIVNAVVTVLMVAVVLTMLGRGASVPGVIGALGIATLMLALVFQLMLRSGGWWSRGGSNP